MYWEWLSGIRLSAGKVQIWLDEDKHLHIKATDYLYRVTLYEVPILAIVSELRNRMLNHTINMTDVLIRLEPKIVLSNQNQMYYYGCGIKKEVDADGARKICDMCEAIKKSMSLTPTDGLGISNSDLDQIGAKSYYDVDRVLQTLTCKASPENDKLQDELTAELGPDVVGKITERRFKSRFKRLVSPIIVPREMYD